MKTSKYILSFMFFYAHFAFSESLCKEDERVLFSCKINKSVKVVSLCGSKALSSTEGYIQYRFGTIGKIELAYPQSRVNSQKKFYLWERSWSGGDVHEVTFINGIYSYTLATNVYRADDGSFDPSYGIVIGKKGESKTTKLDCENKPNGEFDLEGIVLGMDKLPEN